MSPRIALLVGLGFVLALVGPGCDAYQRYALSPGSTFQRGCFPPCLCPILEATPLGGSFLLRHVPSKSPADPFQAYDVVGVSWLAKLGSDPLQITGSGTYRVGGEFALAQQLSLDLSVGGAAPQHFDSGLVPEGAPFPRIELAVSRNGQFCFDTVLEIVAAPASWR